MLVETLALNSKLTVPLTIFVVCNRQQLALHTSTVQEDRGLSKRPLGTNIRSNIYKSLCDDLCWR